MRRDERVVAFDGHDIKAHVLFSLERRQRHRNQIRTWFRSETKQSMVRAQSAERATKKGAVGRNVFI